MKFLLPGIFFLFSVTTALAQNYKLSADPAQFTTDVKNLMAGTRYTASVEVGNTFESTYNSLPPAQQQKIADIAQLMLKAKLKARPHFEDYFSMINSAVATANLAGAGLDNLLQVTEKVMQKTDSKKAQQFLSTSALFLASQKLHSGKDNRLYSTSGTFSFEYVEQKEANWEEPEKPKEEAAPAKPAKKEEPKKKKDDWADDWGDDWGSSWDAPATKKAAAASKDDDWGSPAAAIEEPTAEEAAAVFYPTPQPLITGPIIKFTNADFAIATAFDSTIINNVSGSLLLTEGVFVGNSGTLTWANAGHPASAITAALADYNFDISRAEFSAELVTLTYPEMLSEPVKGNITYKSVRRPASKPASYPRFISLTNNAKITNLGENISYKGGFSLAGTTAASNALDESLSTITVNLGGAPKFRAMAKSYAFGDSIIVSKLAAITIYQGKDSVSHPGMKLKYNKNNQMLTLLQDDGGLRNAVFFDSYHKIELRAEMVKWDLNSKEIDFSILTARTENPLVLESEQYFTPSRYYQTGGVMTFHPLGAVVGYGNRKKVNKFYAHELAEDMKLNLGAVREAMATLARNGYIDYQPKSGLVVLKPRSYHYVESARGKKDYDNLKIESINEANKNATLNLETNDLVVRGVERFYLSDSLGVYVEPTNKEITIKKNRDIEFDGSVYSGNFQFTGTEFKFEYDNFWVNLEKIEKISFIIQDKKAKKGEKGGTNKQSLGSPTQHSNGKLFINKPNNKSNRVAIPRYPYFDAESGSNMYFNRPEVLGGVYDTSIFFNVPPFSVDSLDRKSGNTAIDFKGTFYSGDIFPAFDERLHVMPDNSLGFEHTVPAAGYSVFNKGTFFNKITLNSGGIRGNGKLTYLNATLLSEDFIYYNDSVTTRPGKSATLVAGVVKGVYLPEAMVDNYWLRWDARADSMHIGSIKDPIKLYKNSLTLNGNISLTPHGLYGRGATENQEAKITSNKFHFKEDFFTGRNSTFAIKGEGKKAALRATDALVEFDIKKRTAQFSPETEGVASVTFPALQYKTSLSGGKADFNTKVVTMQMPEGSDIRKSYFYSTHPGQDSLAFLATGAVFDMQKTSLNAYGVPYIAVLDAHIIPDSGHVYVTAGANMKTLHNARIVMDTAQKHHQFHSGELNISSSKRFSGKAIYKFINAGDTEFGIPFNEFAMDSTKGSLLRKDFDYHTRAHGYVEEAANFFITPGVLYKGDVTAFSNKRDLSVKGFAKFAFREDVSSDWFKFEQDVNPALVGFSVDELTSADGAKLHTGLHISAATKTPYSTFASKKADEKDLDVLQVTGVFSYDKKRREYVIGNRERVLEGGISGNIMRYNNQTAGINFAGKFNLFKPDKNFAMEAGGNGIGDPENNSYKLTLTVALDPAMPSQAVDAMASNLAVVPGPQAITTADSLLLNRMAEFVGDKDARKYKEKVAQGELSWPKFSGKLAHAVMLSEVEMHWSQAQNAWYSKGQLGVASIGKQEINKLMPGHFEVRKTPTGNVVSLYLEATPQNWFYISFADSVLKMTSSDQPFNNAVQAKASKKAPSAKVFAMLPAEEMDKYEFVNYFRTTYLGQKAGQAPPPPARVTPTDGIPDAGIQEPEATSKKEKKKKKKKGQEEETLFPGETPATNTDPATREQPETTQPDATTEDSGIAPAEPAEEKGKKKKDKKKKKDEDTLFPSETPAQEQSQPAGTENVPATEQPTPVNNEPVTPPAQTEPEKPATPEPDAMVTPPAQETIPTAEPTEGTSDKKKKKKEKKQQEETPATTEVPATNNQAAEPENVPATNQNTQPEPVNATPVTPQPETAVPVTPTDVAPTPAEPVTPEAETKKSKKEKKEKNKEPEQTQVPAEPAQPEPTPVSTENQGTAGQPAETITPDAGTENTEAAAEEKGKKKKDKKKKKDEQTEEPAATEETTDGIPSSDEP